MTNSQEQTTSPTEVPLEEAVPKSNGEAVTELPTEEVLVTEEIVEPEELEAQQEKKSGGKVWIGFDLGGTKMLCKAYSDKFKELGSRRKKTKSRKGDKSIVDRMIDTIEETLKEAERSKSQIA
ncbi:MAG: ROK family protein, partial [Planctomycetaceae bacterium]|nr:ROK family protein [Planctomycetaceae bacterium]